MLLRSQFALAATLLALGICFPAHAAETTSAADPLLQEARTAFAAGRRYMNERKYLQAVEQFRLAIRVKDTPGLRYYIAYCYEQLDLLLEAQAEYGAAAALLQDFEARDVKDLLPEAQKRVASQLAGLAFGEFPGSVQVSLDGSVIDVSRPVPVNPGTHELVAVTEDGRRWTKTVQLSRASLVRVEFVEMKAEAPRATPVAAPPSEAHQTPESAPAAPASRSAEGPGPGDAPQAKAAVLWSAGGLGALGLAGAAGGIIWHAVSEAQAADYAARIQDEANHSSPCGPSGPGHPSCGLLADTVRDSQTAVTIAWASGIAGGVGVLTLITTALVWKTPPPVQGSLLPVPGGFFGSVSGRF